MKKLTKMFCLIVVAWAAIGCSDDGPLGNDDALRCQGRLGIDGAASATIVSRAEADKPADPDYAARYGWKVPEDFELRLTLTGKDIQELRQNPEAEGGFEVVSTFDYSEQWVKLSDYTTPALYPGNYTALLEYGDPNAIGPDKPYYRGEATAEVVRGETTKCRVEVKIANAAVFITATSGFESYFSDAQFQLYLNDSEEPLKDGEGNAYVFTLADTEEPIFVPAGTKVVVKGSVRRPSQTTANDADGEVLPIEVPAHTTVAGTLHTFRFTAQAGGAQIEVNFEDYETGSTDDVELNDEVESDTPTPDAGGSDAGGSDAPAPAE